MVTPITAITEPISIWTATDSPEMHRAVSTGLSGMAAGRRVSAIQPFIPEAAPTLPMAMAAVRNTITWTGTSPQSLASSTPPTTGILISMAIRRVIQPMSSPVKPLVSHRAMAITTQTRVRSSRSVSLPSLAWAARISSRSRATGADGRNSSRISPRVRALRSRAGGPIT